MRCNGGDCLDATCVEKSIKVEIDFVDEVLRREAEEETAGRGTLAQAKAPAAHDGGHDNDHDIGVTHEENRHGDEDHHGFTGGLAVPSDGAEPAETLPERTASGSTPVLAPATASPPT